jgi:hypothetical protein
MRVHVREKFMKTSVLSVPSAPNFKWLSCKDTKFWSGMQGFALRRHVK